MAEHPRRRVSVDFPVTVDRLVVMKHRLRIFQQKLHKTPLRHAAPLLPKVAVGVIVKGKIVGGRVLARPVELALKRGPKLLLF
jgi:hypothetical protein